jgi:pimeloyl-ACP methyl ester carboxylesterase
MIWTVEGEPRTGRASFAGHDISYRVAGRGPAVVLVKPHRRPKDYPQLRILPDRYLTVQIEPLGFGASDRPREYPEAGLHEQIHAVLDQEMVDRFVIWGYSRGGAMAATVAQASPRVAAMVAGGFSLVTMPTDGQMARMDREQRVPVADRTLWHRYKRYDWLAELVGMRCPRLLYVGGDDRTFARGVRRTHGPLTAGGVTVIEFAGLDHQTGNEEPALSSRIVPTVIDWLTNTVGSSW